MWSSESSLEILLILPPLISTTGIWYCEFIVLRAIASNREQQYHCILSVTRSAALNLGNNGFLLSPCLSFFTPHLSSHFVLSAFSLSFCSNLVLPRFFLIFVLFYPFPVFPLSLLTFFTAVFCVTVKLSKHKYPTHRCVLLGSNTLKIIYMCKCNHGGQKDHLMHLIPKIDRLETTYIISQL